MIVLWLLAFTVALLSGAWLVVIVIATWVAYWHSSYGLFVIAVLLESYFTGFTGLPVLSLSFGAFVLLVETLKIQLLGTKQ